MMVYTLLSLLIVCAILLIDRRKLKQYKSKRENVVYFGFFTVGVVLLVMKGMGAPIPTPLNWISYVLKPLTGFM
ncbi:hypothetical protein ACFQPF_05225 [Fictibacillus iocasae]|uniref:Uncharacterized protein n=1 Tax=Fictibacillus iocasae TaxID=2715437 RepID=A0ABW2NQT9_9BACL